MKKKKRRQRFYFIFQDYVHSYIYRVIIFARLLRKWSPFGLSVRIVFKLGI